MYLEVVQAEVTIYSFNTTLDSVDTDYSHQLRTLIRASAQVTTKHRHIQQLPPGTATGLAGHRTARPTAYSALIANEHCRYTHVANRAL